MTEPKKPKYLPPKVIAVDVDGTLQSRGLPNKRLIKWCKNRKAEGFFLMLWSSRGASYAQKYAERFQVENLFDIICSKPGYIVDDKGWSWIKFTRVIRSLAEPAKEPPNPPS